ncbi:Pseudouridine synthase, catalytic domain-containing protein [Strongyloides ratti]|uniref:Pseudouridine synthase, catalytic domain-containing protein n=1 Tax=Strongyloides ratti TaxID=34506 RepID=A0A090KV35_STRRB|nr:Pseudouridine synthase, catalytic domain-containing protein [Strongyloides ratti]CEF61266.1 Pseudouridine synthase, catalytic domain-containing protein [Strongyloides ratti]
MNLTASEIQKLLTGLFCVYKPKDASVMALKRLISKRIVEDGNEYHNINVPLIQRPIVTYHPKTGAPLVTGLKNQLDYTKHPLVCGFPFHVKDIKLDELNFLEPASSGVCLFGINLSESEIMNIKEKNWITEYKIDAQLGVESYKNLIRGKTIKTAPYSNVNRSKINKVISRLLHFYKRSSFEHHNICLESEEAFEIARKGLPKPSIPFAPIIYNLELCGYSSPYFSIKIQGVNLTDNFLRDFILHFGNELLTLASPKNLRCLRVGPYTINETLLEKDINLKSILKNILVCNDIYEKFKNSDTVVRELTDKELKNDDTKAKYLVQECAPNNENDVKEMIDDLRIPWGRYYNTV